MEDKLKEQKLIRSAKLYNFVPSSSLSIGEKCFLDGAKSEAAKEYWQQSSVDLEEVREKYNELIEDGENQEEEEFFPNIWNLFAPLIKGSEWISVEDRLPDDKKGKEKVIFYGEDYVMMGFFYEGKFRDCMYPHPIVINITHWQPLPQPPTQTKKG